MVAEFPPSLVASAFGHSLANQLWLFMDPLTWLASVLKYIRGAIVMAVTKNSHLRRVAFCDAFAP